MGVAVGEGVYVAVPVAVGVNVSVGVLVMVGVKVIVGVLDGVGECDGVGVAVGVLVGVLVAVGVGVLLGVEVNPVHPCACGVTSISISTRIVRELDDSIVMGLSGMKGRTGAKVVETETNNRSPFWGCTGE